MKRVNKACDAFYEVASEKINTDEDLLKVMSWIEDLNTELSCKEIPSGMSNLSSKDQDNRVLDPVAARSKGRPPSKRISSKVDQIVKNRLTNKKKQRQIHQTCKKNKSQPEVIFNFLNYFLYLIVVAYGSNFCYLICSQSPSK